jgi:hypothetical protein
MSRECRENNPNDSQLSSGKNPNSILSALPRPGVDGHAAGRDADNLDKPPLGVCLQGVSGVVPPSPPRRTRLGHL